MLGRGPALGIDAKSSSASVGRVDFSTGEVMPAEVGERSPQEIRLERFALQSVSRVILRKSTNSRVNNCLRVAANKSGVEVLRSCEHKSAMYRGLQTCGSVWACPVCAAKISERRRVELLGAIDQHQVQGGQVLLLSLTVPHTRGDVLSDLLANQALAMSRFQGSRASHRFWDHLGCIGTVRAWEVTHGDNGWHPHFHVLAFVSGSVFLPEARAMLFEVWKSACRLAGLGEPSWEHGVDIRDGSEAGAYASKWGLDQEMTKGHIKRARKGRTPFDLLRSVLADEDKQAAALFKVYAEAFKGKRQLVWSKGLKECFQIGELTDEEISARQDDTAVLLGKIEPDEWRLILRSDVRGEVLELARHGWEPVRILLDDLMKAAAVGVRDRKPPNHHNPNKGGYEDG